ncbi:MAG: 3-dehydroquinate synthase [Chlorobi bacterium]|nr:3-dehydroquinate synthase [Chlorobiota bacterium]
MDEIRLSVSGATSVITFKASPEDLTGKLQGKNVIVVTDENIFPLYRDLLQNIPVVVIPAGEQEKNLDRAKYLYQELLKHQADRSTWLVGFGGGVITDLTGFVSSTFMRGMNLMFVPTTLLAMVDAAIGGKNGVNLGEYKNMIGTFRQPEQVFVAPDFLQTLPPEELVSGLAEVIKYGLIHDPVILDMLNGKGVETLFSENALLEKLIIRSIRSKVEVVEQDESDHGLRRILNFGHTFGHAVERTHHLSHGEAVSIGMCVAMEWSVLKRMLEPEILKLACKMLDRFGLIPVISPDPDTIIGVMGKDKKIRDGKWVYILLEGPGDPVIRNIDPGEYLAFLHELRNNGFYERIHGKS